MTSRSCQSSSRRGRPSESSAPARISRSIDLLGQLRPVHDVRQRAVRAAGQFGVQALGVLVADPLHQRQPEADPVAGRRSGVQRSREAFDGTTQPDDARPAALPAPAPTHSVVVL